MSTLHNAKAKLVANSEELLALLNGMGIETTTVENEPPIYAEQVQRDKACRKRWEQAHPEKCKEYRQRFLATEKGQALKVRNAEKEKSSKVRAVRKAYRDSHKEQIAEYMTEYNADPKNKERKSENAKKYYAEHKDEINAKAREKYARQKAEGKNPE